MSKKLQHIVLALIALVIINFIGSKLFVRYDLTADKRYTLSTTAKSLIKKIKSPLYINVYLEGDFPSEFGRLQIETRQFLEELQAENNNIRFHFINPDNIRETLIKKGMIPSQLTVEEDGKTSEAIIFPWAEISLKNKTEIVSLLPNSTTQNQEEQLANAIAQLEYSFTNAIHTITQKNKPKVAVLTGNGQLEDKYLYSFLSEVRKKYHLAKFTLDSVAKNPQQTSNTLNKFDLAIIAKPTKKFSDKEKLILDQFVINGKKTLWMVDNVQADTDSLYNDGKMLAYHRDLGLTDLLFNYGVRINSHLIKDLYAAKLAMVTGNVGNQPQFKNLDWFFHPLGTPNPNNPITKNVLPVRLKFATGIDTLKNDIKKTPLLISSILTQKIGIPTIIDLETIATENPVKNNYKSGTQLYGVLLEGNFKSAYKDRTKPFDINNYKKESIDNKMIVIADGDIAKNDFLKNRPIDLSVDKWTKQRFGNKDFLLNAVDYLLDDTGLIKLRNKAVKINLLDKKRAYNEKTYWQFLNIVFPLILLTIFGVLFHYLRRKKYAN